MTYREVALNQQVNVFAKLDALFESLEYRAFRGEL